MMDLAWLWIKIQHWGRAMEVSEQTFALCVDTRSLGRGSPFTGSVVTHSQGRGRRGVCGAWRWESGIGMAMESGWRLRLWMDNYDVATIPSWQPELRRRVLGLRLWLQVWVPGWLCVRPKWQCNMIALGLATCHIYHSSKRWKISHSFILHPNAESSWRKPVERRGQDCGHCLLNPSCITCPGIQ